MSDWSHAVYDLGLSTEQFWGLTPRKFHALSDRWLASNEAKNSRARLIGYYMFSAMQVKKEGGGAFTLADFGLNSKGAADEHLPTLEEYLEGERLGEERLRAFEAGLPNPQPADPLAEIQAMLYKATEALPKNGQ